MSDGTGDTSRDIVVMGASAGGIEVLSSILAGLPEELPAAVAIVQHRPPNASDHLRDILSRASKLPVVWAEQGGRHERGTVYLAPADLHLTFSDGHFNLTASARENRARPSIDRLFRSAAAHYGGRTIGVLLSGMLDDGVAGLVAISRVGGHTVVQDPATAIAPELPRHGVAAVPTSRVIPSHAIAEALVEAVTSSAPHADVPDPIRLESEIDLRTARGEEHDRLEAAMWSAVRALNERSATYESLALDARRRNDESAAKEFVRSARATQDQARLAYEFMQRLTARR